MDYTSSSCLSPRFFRCHSAIDTSVNMKAINNIILKKASSTTFRWYLASPRLPCDAETIQQRQELRALKMKLSWSNFERGTSLSIGIRFIPHVVPLMRELKESSFTGLPNVGPLLDPTNSCSVPTSGSALPGSPRSVDLLFRAKTKMGRYIWVECRGRLHVEPGKGRKSIILSGRAREMMNLKWEHIDSAGGLAG
jgi:hypothetical protein